MNEIYGFLIRNRKPLLSEVIANVLISDCIDTIAFGSYPNFDFKSDSEEMVLEDLELNKISVKPFVVAWKYKIIQPIINRINWMNNLIYIYTEPVSIQELEFNRNRWVFVYNCVDMLAVELFTKSEKIKENIIAKYDIRKIEFPGNIYGPSGWSALK